MRRFSSAVFVLGVLVGIVSVVPNVIHAYELYLQSNRDDASNINISLTVDKPEARPGDNIVITAETDRDCYLTLVYVKEDRNVIVLWPNKASGWEGRVRAGTRVRVGEPGTGLEIKIDGRLPQETVEAYAITEDGGIFGPNDLRESAGGEVREFKFNAEKFADFFSRRIRELPGRVGWGSAHVTVHVDSEGGMETARGTSPWSGWWWPTLANHSCRMDKAGGPADKYDRYVQAATGRNPGWRNWEARKHKSNSQWEGHCHALATASMIFPEPVSTKTVRGVSFSVLDQKGLLTEICYKSPADMFVGNRYPKGGLDDPSPHIFHKTLIEWVGGRHVLSGADDDSGIEMTRGGRPIVADLNPKEEVWNYVIFGYRMNFRKDTSDASKKHVTCTINYANFGPCNANFVGQVKATRTYTYWIKGDVSNPTSGAWTGASRNDHPDFLWHASYPQPDAGCPISVDIVKQIVK